MFNWRKTSLSILILALALSAVLLAQTMGSVLRGTLTDDSGAIIPGATVRLSGNGVQRTAGTQADGTYVFMGLSPGKYTVRVVFPGFAAFEGIATVEAGRTVQFPVKLSVSLEKQSVTVKGEPGPTLSTEPDNNAGALVLRGTDLEALPDDPDDLAADLQALAGPAAGPNGGQIFIDGFSGGRLPPKESIREIRINQNPFSAEYDRLGFGRIEILTKPGSDKFRGSAFFSDSDAVFNSRNPMSSTKPEFSSKMYGGNLSGPISKKSSFFVDFERRDIHDNAVINGQNLDASNVVTPFHFAVVTPQERNTISPRIDYQLSTNNTIVGRYTYEWTSQDNAGIGGFTLPSLAYTVKDTHHNLQLTETSVLSTKMIDETRIQYTRTNVNDTGDNTRPTISVAQAFTDGGAQIGNSYNDGTHFELQNYISRTAKKHTMRFGVRIRRDTTTDYSPRNFGGTFNFSGGGFAPVLDANNKPVLDASGAAVLQPLTSLEQYRRTVVLLKSGMTMDQVRALGGGATQFTIAGGNPMADINQTDANLFFQDDWRVKSNFTLSLGARWETQTNIHDHHDFAPRIGFAWAPGSAGAQNRAKTVVRGGFGIFYDRVAQSLSLQALRFNGVNQLSYIVPNPNFFTSNIPAIAALTAQKQPGTIRELSDGVRAPYVMQSAIGVERQLPRNTTAAVTFTNSHALRQLYNRNINTPLPGSYNPLVPGSGVYPYGAGSNLFLYESGGVMNQNMLMTNVNSRVNSNISLFGFLSMSWAHSNTDGASSTPMNPYNRAADYSRSSMDTRERFVLGGSVTAPLALRFSPFIMQNSGRPFDITAGRDLNGDTLFDDRPAFATDLTRNSVVKTKYGNFDTNPLPGAKIIPRNYVEGPGSVTVNLRVSRTFGFGPTRGGNAAMSGGSGGGDHGPGGGGDRGGRGGGGMRGGPGGGGMRMGGGMRGGMDGGGSTEHRFNVTVSISARNLLNTVNLGTPVGNLASPFFGTSTSLAGGFGPGGSTANNRRVDMQLRFTF